MRLDQATLDQITDGLTSEANRLMNTNPATMAAYDQLMYQNGNNAVFDESVARAAQLYTVTMEDDQTTPLAEIAFASGRDAFQWLAAYLMNHDNRILNSMTQNDADNLYTLYSNANRDLATYQQRHVRHQPQQRSGYGGNPRPRTSYGSNPRPANRQMQPRNNGIPSNHSYSNTRPPANNRYGAPATGANIGRSGGGFSQLQRLRQAGETLAENTNNSPPPRQGVENVINITRQPNLAEEVKVPVEEVSEEATVLQVEKYRPEYRPSNNRVAPTLYDLRKHIPLYKVRLKRGVFSEVVDEIIIAKDSNEGKIIMEKAKNVPDHESYLYLPRRGENKDTNLNGDQQTRSALGKLAGDQVPFEVINEQLVKSNNTIEAKEGAKLPAVFTQKAVEVTDIAYGTMSNTTERLFRLVDHVNKHLAPLNPDQSYSNLVVFGTVRDILPFNITHPEDVATLQKLMTYMESHKNVASCVQTMRRLEQMLPPREWNVLNDAATAAINTVGVVDFALPEPISNFTDEVQTYVSLVDQHYGRDNGEKFAGRIVEKFLAAINLLVTQNQATFVQDYRVVILPIETNDLSIASTTQNLNVGLVSQSVLPDLYYGLDRQLNLCESTILSLVVYTRDGTALEVRRTPVGDSILLSLIQ